MQEQKERGVIAASAGNHALALAYHGQALNVPVTVVMPENCTIVKEMKCRGYGAKVLNKGHNLAEVGETTKYPQRFTYYAHGFLLNLLVEAKCRHGVY